MTRHALQLFKIKRSKVKVTRSRDVSADKNAITRQWMVVSISNLLGIIDVGVDVCGILSRSVGLELHLCFETNIGLQQAHYIILTLSLFET